MKLKTTYTAEVGEKICAGLAEGLPLLQVCKRLGIKYQTAIDWEWRIEAHGEAAKAARVIGCHALADQCIEIADTPETATETITKADGGVETRVGDAVNHRRLRIDTRMRLLGKWLPKVYGDKLELGGELAVKKSAADLTDAELAAVVAAGVQK